MLIMVYDAEFLTMGGLTFLIVNGPITFFIVRFAVKLINDPEYEDKVFKKSMWKKS